MIASKRGWQAIAQQLTRSPDEPRAALDVFAGAKRLPLLDAWTVRLCPFHYRELGLVGDERNELEHLRKANRGWQAIAQQLTRSPDEARAALNVFAGAKRLPLLDAWIVRLCPLHYRELGLVSDERNELEHLRKAKRGWQAIAQQLTRSPDEPRAALDVFAGAKRLPLLDAWIVRLCPFHYRELGLVGDERLELPTSSV